MSRPTRNQVLNRLYQDDYCGREDCTDPVHQAARLYVGLAPDTCPTCDGDGVIVGLGYTSVPGNRFGERHDTHYCSKCAGRGYVWPDKLVVLIAEVLATMERVPESWRFDKARRVLDALVEVDDHE